MSEQKTIILTRYLLILAHFVLIVTILMSRDANVKAGLPYSHSKTEYSNRDYDFVINLSLSIGFIALEFITFCSGLTMFSTLPNVISILAHFLATIIMSFSALDEWDSRGFWFIFGFGNCLPVACDLIAVISIFCFSQMKYA